jgi:uncharacterized protein (TIGR02271 family)
MSILGSLFGTEDNENNNPTNMNNKNNGQETEEGTLQLRKEELDINKNKVQTGEVILSKEIVEEQQTVNVPVTHEEVVIERRTLNNQPTDSQISSSSSSPGQDFENSNRETIRIPVTEEKVEIGKHTVVTEEISAHKRNVEETQKVDETLRREEVHVDKNGDPIITNNDTSSDDNALSDGFQ